MTRTIEADQFLSDLSRKASPTVLGLEWRIGLVIAVLLHIGLLYGFQAAVRRPAAFPADGGIEITMIAAPAESEAPFPETAAAIAPAVEPAIAAERLSVEPVAESVPEPTAESKAPAEPLLVSKAPEPPPQPAPVSEPVETSTQAAPSLAPPVQQIALARPASRAVNADRVVGNGSSSGSGLDAVSTQAHAGVRAKPNYLRNPEPPYPALARRRRQEGTVLLAVTVSAAGHATRVELRRTSGYPALDAAALEAVPGWEFEPARLGSAKVESEIEVPVRFQLSR